MNVKMIKRLHILVIKSYIGPLVMTFFIAEFVLMMHFLWLYIEDLVGKGLEWSIVAELMLYASAGLVKMALPLAILLASIMTFGNFGEHFELSAMKSAGISLQRIMMPLIIFSVFLSVASFFWSNNVIPNTNRKTGALLYDISNQRPELNIKPGIFNNGIDGFTIKIKNKNPNTPMMYDFMIYDHQSKRGNPKVTLADSGYMQITDNQKYMIVTLYGGRTYEEMAEKSQDLKIYPERHETFDKQTIILELKGFDLERTDESLFKHHYQMKTISQLQHSQDSLNKMLTERKNMFLSGLSRSRFFKYTKRGPQKFMHAQESDDSQIKGVYKDTANQYIKNNHLEKIKQQIKNNSPVTVKSKITKTIPEQVKQPIVNTLPDSIKYRIKANQVKQKVITENIDTLLKNTSPDSKVGILNMALESAKNARSQIESNKLDITERQKNIYKHEIAWHEKFTLSFACLIFFFIGAPLGAIIRKGGFGLPFLVSILFFIVYYIVSIFGRKLVEESALLPWQGMWLSSLLALPLGIIFTYKATTDSALFDVGGYVDLIKKPFKVLQLQYKDPTIVFHKDIEMPDNKIIQDNLVEFEQLLKDIAFDIDSKSMSFKKIYLSLFTKDQSDLKLFIEKYNTLYDILSVKCRDRKFLKASLEKFPKLDFEMYEITKRKRIANYFLLTILFIPAGLYLILLSYLMYKVLKQKTDIIKEQLVYFYEKKENIHHELKTKKINDKFEKLRSLDNEKLIDVVKNYRQYGYDNEYRDNAISILENRGVHKEHLALTGNLENLTYDRADEVYNSFTKNSKTAFALYTVILLTNIIAPILFYKSSSYGTVTLIVNLLASITFLVFLYKAYFNQIKFYKITGSEYGKEGVLVYFFGMPIYFILYFYFRSQMKDRMKEIR
jgi:lipopolysaccharide export system permease protein